MKPPKKKHRWNSVTPPKRCYNCGLRIFVTTKFSYVAPYSYLEKYSSNHVLITSLKQIPKCNR